MNRQAAFAILFLMLASHRAFGQFDNAESRKTLGGLKSVGLFVPEIPPMAERAGFTRADILSGAEARLKQAGVQVVPAEQSGKLPGAPLLSLDISLVNNGQGTYAISVQSRLTQAVRLQRVATITGYAATWLSSEAVITTGEGKLKTTIDVTNAKVDEFVTAWSAVNRK